MQIRVCSHLVDDPTKSVGTVDYRPFALEGAPEPVRYSLCAACLRSVDAYLIAQLAAPPVRSSFPPRDPPTVDDHKKPKVPR
jgi:hypothetical protein